MFAQIMKQREKKLGANMEKVHKEEKNIIKKT